jgi:hypothetical protein
MVVMGEFGDGLDVGGGSAESLENSSDVSTWLHGNDSQLILLINPDEESLVGIVENTSA